MSIPANANKINLLLFAALFLSFSSMAQKGKFVFYTKPSDGIVKIDTMRFTKAGNAYDLDTGKYIIQVWAPTAQLITDTILIKANQFTLYRKKLPFTKEYTDYEKRLAKYKRPLKTVIIYTASATALYLLNLIPLNDNYNKAQHSKELYEENIALEGINHYKDEYNNYQEKYELHRTINNVLVISSAIIIPTSIVRIVYLHKKNKRPEYHEQPLISNTEINLRTNYKDSFGFSLTHRF